MARDFQIFVKPVGGHCNLACRYCYYTGKVSLYGKNTPHLMEDEVLERYIIQHIEATEGDVIRFSWHGGEPMMAGINFFRKVLSFQKRYRPPKKRILNGIQTNGILLDENWCRFFSEAGFAVGISLDGPKNLHDAYRIDRKGRPTHENALRGQALLKKHKIPHDILCVVHNRNVTHPLDVYRFFKKIGARYIGFLPLVESASEGIGVSKRSVNAEMFGEFLCRIFDEWITEDIGKIRIQIFEEAIGGALKEEHHLCVFRKTCGDIPVIEKNGDFYVCDHFVHEEHLVGNIMEKHIVELLENHRQRAFGRLKEEMLSDSCRRCEFLDMCNGGCPKDRIIVNPLSKGQRENYLCPGYKRFFGHIKPFFEQVSALFTSISP